MYRCPPRYRPPPPCSQPFAELLGAELPAKAHVVVVLCVSFCLGVLVTYAEPAIAALRPLGELVDPREAPYLYYMMNQNQVYLFLFGRGEAGALRGQGGAGRAGRCPRRG